MIMQLKRRLFVFILLLAFTPARSFNLDSLLIVSIGGQEAFETLRSVSTYYAEGEVNINGQRGRFFMYSALPDKMYLEVNLGAFSITQAYDGQVAWQRDHNGAVSRLAGYEERELMKQVYFQSYSYLFKDRIPGGKEYRGTTVIDDDVYHLVAVFPLYVDTVLLHYDVKSGLQRLMVSRLDNVETQTFSEDFRSVSGILMPFFSRAEASNASLFSEFFVETVSLNQPVELSLFSIPSESKKDYYFPEGVDWVMMPFDFSYGHIYLTAVINGKKKARFILDSGASANVFHQPTIGSLDLPSVGSLPAKGIGGFKQLDLVRTDSISIGGLTFYNQVAGATDLGRIGRAAADGTPFGGVLGYDFLSRFPIMIDYAGRALTVYNPDRFELPEGGEEVPFHLTMQVPTIEAELNGIHGSFLIDLGNAFGLILHDRFVQANGLEDKLDDVQDISGVLGGFGGQVAAKSAYAASFAFGGVRVQSLRVFLSGSAEGIAGSEELAGNIGNMFLEQFRLLIDYNNSRLIFYEGAKP